MINVKQITNHDLSGAGSTTKTITIGDETRQVEYKIINSTLLKGNSYKMGYCCEPKGIGYPIYLTINGTNETTFYIGKTGMLEFQPEEWTDLNSEEPEVKETDVFVTEVKVPAGIAFTLDYII